jgi:hypothetical protein
VARKLLGTSSLLHVSHSAMAAGRRVLLSAMSATRATVVSIKGRKIELALVNPVAWPDQVYTLKGDS